MLQRVHHRLLVAIRFAVLALATSSAATAAAQFGGLEVAPFKVLESIQLPADFQGALLANLLEQMAKTQKFSLVFATGEPPPGGPAPAVRLTGVITEFKRGSRAKRYFIGYGAGKTLVKAHVQFIDVQTGTVRLEKDVDGKVFIGLFGGDSKGATNGLTKEVAKLAKSKLR